MILTMRVFSINNFKTKNGYTFKKYNRFVYLLLLLGSNQGPSD